MPSAKTRKAARPKAKRGSQAGRARKDTVKIRKVGGSLGVILPKEVLDSLNLKEGDEMFVLRTPDGVKLTPYDPKFAQVMKFARDFMRRYRDDMRELAK